MASFVIESVPARLAGNTYNLDERICPAKVYSVEADGTVGVEYAACLECGTCLAVSGDEGGERREVLTRHRRRLGATLSTRGESACHRDPIAHSTFQLECPQHREREHLTH